MKTSDNATPPNAQEPNVQLQFQGYTLDFFTADSGALGLTIERSPAHENNHCIDLFVSPTLKVSGDGIGPSEITTQEISNALDTASLEALLSAAEDLLSKEAARVSNITLKPEYKYAAALVAAIAGYTTERGTTTEQDELLRKAGFKLPLLG